MKPVPQDVMSALCESCQVGVDKLAFLGGGRGDSDGIVYRTADGRALKIVPLKGDQPKDLLDFDERIRFVHYLGENGVSIAHPLPLPEGMLYAMVRAEGFTYVSYMMPICAGENPENKALVPALARSWGKMTGRAHRVTKAYPIWKNTPGKAEEYFYQNEISFFENWCKDEAVKDLWAEMLRHLDALPKNRDNYGFIHNDNHQRNILADEDRVTWIDFDCAGGQFFVQDVLTPMQGLLFEDAGGLFAPIHHPDRLSIFLRAFLDGYETENHIDQADLARLDTFLNYRRLLLYTCMQDWLDTIPELKNGFRAMMGEKPSIERLI